MPTPDADRIEAELVADELAALVELLRVHRIERPDWPAHPACTAFVDLAFSRAMDRAIRTGRSRSRSAAFRQVGFDLGVRGDSVRRRWERYASMPRAA